MRSSPLKKEILFLYLEAVCIGLLRHVLVKVLAEVHVDLDHRIRSGKGVWIQQPLQPLNIPPSWTTDVPIAIPVVSHTVPRHYPCFSCHPTWVGESATILGVQEMARAFLPVSQHHATPYAAGMVFVTVMQQIMLTEFPPEPKRFGVQITVGGGVAFLDYFLTEEGKNREIYRCTGRN